MWHLMLSLTSLIFRIPKVRIREGSRIWPEFRLHSIVFACRSLACLVIVFLEKRYDPHGEPRYWANVLVVFATLLGADLATASVDPSSRSNTIRGLETSAATQVVGLLANALTMLQFGAPLSAIRTVPRALPLGSSARGVVQGSHVGLGIERDISTS